MRSYLLGAALALTPAIVSAQNLGPFRQFLSVEPYYVNTQLDDGGSGVGRTSLNGLGARLWVNYAPFVRSRTLAKGGLALFYQQTFSKHGVGVVRHYGAQQDVFFTNRPLGGFIDPVLSVAGGGYRIGRETKFALTPGLGVRIPIPNRLQLRVDARDALILGTTGANGAKRTANNMEYTAALGLTF